MIHVFYYLIGVILMQELLAQMLWESEDVHTAAAQLCDSMPEFKEARQQYEETAEQVQSLIGYELLDRLCSQLSLCTSCEVRAYYCLGLGLREELVKALCL